MDKTKGKVIVVGGGAAGMMAAGRAAQLGAQVTLIERNKRLGKKILITGKGRCNVTNAGEIEEIINNFPGNGKFLYGPLYTFSNQDLMGFFNNYGVELKVERGNRVFPVSDQAQDIVTALEKYLQDHKVKIIKGKQVRQLLVEEGQIQGVVLEDGQSLLASRIIITTGGCSYPGTGSSGDGYRWAEELGHRVVPVGPGLIPLETKEPWVKSLQGLSLKNVEVSLEEPGGKVLATDFGEMLFTHFGVSGPIILTISRQAINYWQKKKGPLNLRLDLKPALTLEQLDQRLQRDIQKYSNKQLKNSLDDLLPQRLIPVVIELSGLETTKVMHQITKEERERLGQLLKNLNMVVERARPIAEAIVTTGGISVKEVDPQTMESKIIKGLYFAGEVLDIDGFTGGYNLQGAFSTGYVAGDSAGVFE